MSLRHLTLITLILIFSIPNATAAQTMQGVPWYTIPLPLPNGFVDVATRNIHLEIPIASIPERNGETLVSKVTWEPTGYSLSWHNQFGMSGPGWWVNTGTGRGGSGGFSSSSQDCTSAGYPSYPVGQVQFYYFNAVDSHGTSHPDTSNYTMRVSCNTTGGTPYGSGSDIPSFVGMTTDGSGYTLKVTNYASLQVVAPDGTIAYDGGYGPYQQQYPVDTNGNYSRAGIGSIPDSLGRTPITYQPYQQLGSICSSGAMNLSATARASDGTSNTFTLNCATINVSQVSGGTQYTGTVTTLGSIGLPDGTQYSFAYDSGTAGEHHGGLLSITIPSGGVITFGGGNSVTTVSYGGNTWTISPVYNNSTRQTTTTVTSPPRFDVASNSNVSDKTVFVSVPNFPYVQSAQYYNGPSTLLRTVTTTYDTSGVYYLPIKVTTTNDAGQTSSISYQYLNNAMRDYPTQKQETDFTGAIVRTTVTQYTGSFNKPSSVKVYAGSNTSGTPASSTLYFYDEYSANYCKNGVPMLTNVTGATSHDDTNFGMSFTARGNVTTIQRLISGSTYSTTHMCYDTLGNVTQTIDANGNPTTFDYSENWYDTNCIPSGTNTHTFPTTITDALGHREKKSYYSCTSLPQSAKDENDIQTSRSGTTYTYDLFGRSLAVTNSAGGQSGASYSSSAPPSVSTSTLITSSPSLSQTGTSLADSYGRKIQSQLTSDPDGTTYVDTTYDALGHASTISNPHRASSAPTDGITTTNYDALGRITRVIEPDGATVNTTYSGTCSTTTDESGKSRKSCADAFGRLVQVFEDPGTSPHLNYETDYAYDVLNNLLSVNQKGNDPNSANWRTRTFTYDSLSRLLCASNPENSSAPCPTTATTAYTTGTTGYVYDANGNLSTKTSPKPNQTGSATVVATYTYDALNRLTQKSFNDGSTPTVKYGHDGTALTGCTTAPPSLAITNGVGRRTAMCDGAGAETWAYDSMGRTLFNQRKTNNITKQFAYTYNLDGSLAIQTHPATNPADVWPTHTFPFTYTQGGAGRSVSLYYAATGLAYNVHYAPGGALCYMNSGFGQTFTQVSTFNNRLQPTRIQIYGTGHGPANSVCPAASADTNVGLDLGYTYPDASGHNNGNITTIANNVVSHRSQTFAYDALNRLTTAQTTANHSVDAANCWAETYKYDPWGNLLKLGADTVNQSAYVGCTQESGFDFSAPGLIGTNNRIATAGYSYDAAGNLTTSPGAGTVTFDAENHMIAAGGLSYAYDGDGNRIWKAPVATPTSPNLIYWYGGSGNLLQESDGAGIGQYSHIYFNGQRIKRAEWLHGGWFDHYGYDHLGNARFVYGYNGATDVSDFYPFGGERPISSAEGNKFKFTGKERDSESGLDNFGARFDSSVLGRFMSPDWSDGSNPDSIPYADLNNPQSFNLYSYGKNNPESNVDINGHCDVDGEHHNWLWCAGHTLGITMTTVERAAMARKDLAGGKNFLLNGLAPADFVKTATDAEVIAARKLVREFLLSKAYDAMQPCGGAEFHGTPVSCGVVFPIDFATGETENASASFGSEGEARALARTKLGEDAVEVEPGKLRSKNGKWQYRAKPGDLAENHIHLEELDPKTGRVIRNLHLRWPQGTER